MPLPNFKDLGLAPSEPETMNVSNAAADMASAIKLLLNTEKAKVNSLDEFSKKYKNSPPEEVKAALGYRADMTKLIDKILHVVDNVIIRYENQLGRDDGR